MPIANSSAKYSALVEKIIYWEMQFESVYFVTIFTTSRDLYLIQKAEFQLYKNYYKVFLIQKMLGKFFD